MERAEKKYQQLVSGATWTRYMWWCQTLSNYPNIFFNHLCILLLQLSCYDQSKQLFLNTGYLTDNILTHFLASVFAVSDPTSVFVYITLPHFKTRCSLLFPHRGDVPHSCANHLTLLKRGSWIQNWSTGCVCAWYYVCPCDLNLAGQRGGGYPGNLSDTYVLFMGRGGLHSLTYLSVLSPCCRVCFTV